MAASAQELAPSPERIAFRYDDTHVIVRLDQTGGDVHDNPADQLTPLPPPHTRFTGLDEIGTSDDLMGRFGELFGRTATGQVWAVQGDGQHLFAATVETLAFASSDCATAIDALAILRISPEQQQEFQNFPGDYFLAVSSTSGRLSSGSVSLAPGEVKLAAAQVRALKVSLNEALQAELRRIKAASAKNPNERAEDASRRWTAADARLAKGEGKLAWQAQRLVAGPHGEERLYLRATWSLGDYAAFLMTAWVLPENMRFEAVEPHPAAWMRSGELKEQAPQEAMMGQILGIYPGEDGWARVLIGSAQGDGYEMEIIQLTPSGPRETDIAYGYGC